MKTTFSGWRYLWKSEDIRSKLTHHFCGFWHSIGLRRMFLLPVLILRFLLHSVQSSAGGGNFLDFLDLLSGGTVSNFSLLSMGVYPYITAQIILQLLIPIIPALQRRMEEDPREAS